MNETMKQMDPNQTKPATPAGYACDTDSAKVPRSPLTFRELTRANTLRQVEAFEACFQWSPSDWAVAMAGECGEACNLIKKLRRGDKVSRGDIGRELADMVTYADILATRLGIDLGEAVVDKFNEVSNRARVTSTVKL